MAIQFLDSSATEAHLIGAVMNDNSLLYGEMSSIKPEHFSNTLHGDLWRKFLDLSANGSPIDWGSLMSSAPQIIQRIGTDRLADMRDTYAGRTEIKFHIDKLMELHARKQIMQGAQQLIKKASDTDTTPDELKAEFERIAMSFSDAGVSSGLQNGTALANQWHDGVEKRYLDPHSAFGMLTGLTDLDSVTLGFQRSDLSIVGGRTSTGKTAFAIEILVRLQERGYKAAMFSLEMSREQVHNRIAGNIGKVGLSMIRLGRLQQSEFEAISDPRLLNEFIAEIPIDDTRGVTTDYIISEMKRWKRKYGLDFVIVDYLQEINEPPLPQDNAGSALGRIVRKLRKAAAECDCAVMALSQLNREADGKPKPSHLSGSAGIESAADVLILLHRDREETPDILEVNIAKQRNGPTKEIELHYDRNMQRISNLARDVDGVAYR